MTKLLSAALIAAAMVTTPAMARTSHVTSRHRRAMDANASASPAARHIDGRVGTSAPRVGAFPPAPPDGENCDVGDNPFIC
jgi:hypothetical protein